MFPLAVQNFNILGLEVVKIPKLCTLFTHGGIYNKVMNARGNLTESLQISKTFTSQTLGDHHSSNCEKLGFQNEKKIQKLPIFLCNFSKGIPSGKMTSNKGHFGKFWVLKSDFLLNKPSGAPKVLEEDQWAHCRHFGHLSPGVRSFPPKAPIFENDVIFGYLPTFRG